MGSTEPRSASPPEPPRDFRGGFFTAPDQRDRCGRSSGPIRLRPLAVACPTDAEDLGLLVRWAGSEGVALVPRGAGTGMPGGNVGSGICVDLSGWTQRCSVDPETRTADVTPSVLGAQLDAAARAHGLFFPALPSSADRCTLGGMIANNAAGARSHGFGAMRSWVESLDVVLADGSTCHLTREPTGPSTLRGLRDALSARLGTRPSAWPKVRKNASGYALDQFLPSGDPVSLLVGSEGTLGFITAARLSLAPLPESVATIFVAVPNGRELNALLELSSAETRSTCEFFSSRFIDVAALRSNPVASPLLERADGLLLVELEGDAASVEEDTRVLRRNVSEAGVPLSIARSDVERDSMWMVRHAASPVIAERAREGLVSMQFIEDSVVPPESLGVFLDQLDNILLREETEAVIFGHAGDGNLHVNPLIDVHRANWRARVRRILEATVDLVSALGGTLSGEHGDGRIRAPFQERIWGTDIANAFGIVKDTLDPRGILNPGVVLPLQGQDPLEGISELGGSR